jgi:hypothetical protein
MVYEFREVVRYSLSFQVFEQKANQVKIDFYPDSTVQFDELDKLQNWQIG